MCVRRSGPRAVRGGQPRRSQGTGGRVDSTEVREWANATAAPAGDDTVLAAAVEALPEADALSAVARTPPLIAPAASRPADRVGVP